MAINGEGLIAVVGTSESAAANAVNSLHAGSTAQDLVRANFEMSKFPIVTTAVTGIISKEAEAKTQPARIRG